MNEGQVLDLLVNMEVTQLQKIKAFVDSLVKRKPYKLTRDQRSLYTSIISMLQRRHIPYIASGEASMKVDKQPRVTGFDWQLFNEAYLSVDNYITNFCPRVTSKLHRKKLFNVIVDVAARFVETRPNDIQVRMNLLADETKEILDGWDENDLDNLHDKINEFQKNIKLLANATVVSDDRVGVGIKSILVALGNCDELMEWAFPDYSKCGLLECIILTDNSTKPGTQFKGHRETSRVKPHKHPRYDKIAP